MEGATDLKERVTQVMREAGAALRAVDIVQKLAESGTVVGKEAVNRALYSGLFERAEGPGAPRWTPRAEARCIELPPSEEWAVFAVGGVGMFGLRSELAAEHVGAILGAALAAAGSAPVVRVEDTEDGKKVAELVAGRARVEPFKG